MAEVVEILGMRRERKQKTTDNENMETGVKIHHPVGSRISMTLDEVTLRNKQDRHQTNKKMNFPESPSVQCPPNIPPHQIFNNIKNGNL